MTTEYDPNDLRREFLSNGWRKAIEEFGPCEATLDGEHEFRTVGAFTEYCEECYRYMKWGPTW